MSGAVYVLCAVTSLLCALLLLRGYRQSRHRLLFWSALCFAGLALNNALMVLDYALAATADLMPARHVTAHLSMWILLYGLVWTSRAEP
jgi:hypothetical protein